MTDTTSDTASECPDFLASTRTFYDAIAEDYAEHFRAVNVGKALERGLLAVYAELVGAGGGTVADLGCGPGRVTGHLASLGLDVFGLDLSESMLGIARRENPGLRFEQGSMLDLDVPDGTLAGVVSWYSSIHTPDGQLTSLLDEFHRALAPGGHLLLAFQAGDRPRRLEHPFGHPVSLDFRRRDPGRMAELLTGAGFALVSRTVREPDPDLAESVPQAFLFARKA
ncbi:class I SAM-dependent methyltransferase [Streptomyces sp. NPDC047028]|uniref:class I SAM-dependent DNA methyltransferase n=1 Tax=Streptomyces sp. NPDC047028 TaxID=3155793 RepID=UPI003405EB04